MRDNERQVEKVEYRVAYNVQRHGERLEFEIPLADPASLNEAESRIEGVQSTGRFNVRIQKRTVTYSPWEDQA